MAIEQTPYKIADTLAASSAGLAGVAWLADVEPYISVVAGIVAIVAGCAATWYHVERAINAHIQREKDRIKRELTEELEAKEKKKP